MHIATVKPLVLTVSARQTVKYKRSINRRVRTWHKCNAKRRAELKEKVRVKIQLRIPLALVRCSGSLPSPFGKRGAVSLKIGEVIRRILPSSRGLCKEPGLRIKSRLTETPTPASVSPGVILLPPPPFLPSILPLWLLRLSFRVFCPAVQWPNIFLQRFCVAAFENFPYPKGWHCLWQ